MPQRDPQRYWEDVREGEEIPGHAIRITPTEIVITINGTNTLDPVHHDREFTQAGGHLDMFMETSWYNGHFGHLLSDFAGMDGWVKRMSQQMRRMNHPGDTVTFRGKVTRRYLEDGDYLVDLDVWAENPRDGVTTPGQATVMLPSRTGWIPGFPEPAEVYWRMSPLTPGTPPIPARPAEELRTPEDYLKEARKFIGWESAPRSYLYPIEYEPIRRFLRMTRNDNPLYWDAEYAKGTRFGGVICPPGYGIARSDVWPPPSDVRQYLVTANRLFRTPGDRPVNLQSTMEYYRPVHVGDRITTKTRQDDVYMKAIRVDPKAFWSATAAVSWNQHGEIVAIGRGLFMAHRTPDEVQAAGEA